jgi:hypothetical protein
MPPTTCTDSSATFFPSIGMLHVGDVTHRVLIAAFRKIEARGAHGIAQSRHSKGQTRTVPRPKRFDQGAEL